MSIIKGTVEVTLNCIASQKRLELELKAEGDVIEPACSFCTGQLTFENNPTGPRVVTVRALVHND